MINLVDPCKQYRSTAEFSFIDSTVLINLGDPRKRAFTSKVYTGRRNGDLAELRNRIIDAVQKITPQMPESGFRETLYRFELCRDTDGRYVETNK